MYIHKDMKKSLDPSKSVLLANSDGLFSAHSTEETLARGLNRFKNWLCAAGTETIHIGYNGDIQIAACGAYGTHGNIFNNTIELPKDWVVCNQEACMCGGDMQIRKAASEAFVQKSLQKLSSKAQQVDILKDHQWVAPYHFQDASNGFNTVSWDMGKRCNYACSYCPPEVSNRTDPLYSWDKIKTATDRVLKVFSLNKQIKWVITGGEPTIIPSYLDWVDYVREKNHIVHTTTNGSRGPKYLSQLIEKSCIGLSLHLEFLDLDRLEESCRQIIHKKLTDKDAAMWWFGVRVMVPPGKLDLAMSVKKRLYDIPQFSDVCQFFMSPVHSYIQKNDGVAFGGLLDYQTNELQQIQSHT